MLFEREKKGPEKGRGYDSPAEVELKLRSL